MSDNSNQFSFDRSPPRAVPAEEVGSQPEGSDDMYSLDDLGGLGGAIVMVEEETFSSTSTPPPQDGGVDQQKQSEAVVSQLVSRDDDDEMAVSRGTESQGPRGACSKVFPGMRQAGGRQGPSDSGHSGQSGLGAADGQGFPQAVAAPGCEPGDGVLGADAEGLGAVDAEEHAPRLSNAPGSKALAPSASAKGKPKAGANDSGPSRRRAGGTETDGEVASGGSSSRQISRRSSAGRGRNSSPPNFGPTRQSRPSRSASLGAKSAQQYFIGDTDDSGRSISIGTITPRSVTPRGNRGNDNQGSRSRSPSERNGIVQITDWIMPGESPDDALVRMLNETAAQRSTARQASSGAPSMISSGPPSRSSSITSARSLRGSPPVANVANRGSSNMVDVSTVRTGGVKRAAKEDPSRPDQGPPPLPPTFNAAASIGS